jgi:hypothetical protein
VSVIDPVPSHWRDRWADLPLMQVPAVMNDDDVQVHNDNLYFRRLLDAILDECADLRKAGIPFSLHGFPVLEVRFIEPWPDHAAQLLTDWRRETETAA